MAMAPRGLGSFLAMPVVGLLLTKRDPRKFLAVGMIVASVTMLRFSQLNLGAGYTNAFYASGSTTSGFGNVILVGELIYNMSLTSKAGLGYRHDFQNSPFVGNFYNLDAVYAALREYIGGRVATAAYARFENRRYQGLAQSRTDQVVIGGLTADYVIQRVLYIGVGYTLTLARTDNTNPATNGGNDFTKHVVVARVGVVY